MQGAAGGHLQLLCLDVELPAFLSDADCSRIHETIAQVLRQSLRASETIGRIAPLRYLAVLPRCPKSAYGALVGRLAVALAAPAGLGNAPDGVRVWLRFGDHDPSVTSGAEFLERTLAGERQAIFPFVPAAPRTRRASTETEPVRVTLALGGTLSQAVAHVGVLRALRRAGVQVAGVAGTNGGALVGAMIAARMHEDTVMSTLADLAGSDLHRRLRRATAGGTIAGRGELTVRRAPAQPIPVELYQELIQFFVGEDREIARLPTRFVATATDLAAGRLVHLGYGSLHRALRASCATPGLFPLERDGERDLVNGSILAEVPVAAAASLDPAAPVLAVYLERPEPPIWQVGRNPDLEARTHALARAELVRAQLRDAAIVLPVPVPDLGWFSIREAASLVEIGEEAAEQAMPDLLARLTKLATKDGERVQ